MYLYITSQGYKVLYKLNVYHARIFSGPRTVARSKVNFRSYSDFTQYFIIEIEGCIYFELQVKLGEEKIIIQSGIGTEC